MRASSQYDEIGIQLLGQASDLDAGMSMEDDRGIPY
jgi:hypothetical protein